MRCFSCLEPIDRQKEEWHSISLISEGTGNKFDVAMHKSCIDAKEKNGDSNEP